MNSIIERCNLLGSGFVRFALPMLIQSGLVIVVLLLVDLVLRKKVRAVFRYWLWMLVLVKLVLPVTLTSPTGPGYWIRANWPSPSAFVQVRADLSGRQSAEAIAAGSIIPEVEPIDNKTAPVGSALPSVSLTRLTLDGSLFLIWLGTVIALVIIAIHRACFVTRLIARTKEAAEPMHELLRSCSKQMRIRKPVSLRVSANAASPVVCGLRKSVILIPENLAEKLGRHKLRAVLLHELAHIKRGDLWVNLVQTIVQIVYFYNPLLWIANAVIRRVREQAVDEMVLVAMGDEAEEYPGALLSVAKLSLSPPALALRLIGVVESKNALTQRIKRILARPFPITTRLGFPGLVAILLSAALLLPMSGRAVSENRVRGDERKLASRDGQEADDEEIQRWRQTTWQMKIALDMPDLIPPAVQWAIFDEDPIPKFKARLEKVRDRYRKQLNEAKDPAKRDIIQSSQMQVRWNSVFKDVSGDRVSLLTSAPGMSYSASSNGPAGKKWIVTKFRKVKGEPVCWSLPVETEIGKEIDVVLTKENVFNLAEVFDEVMSGQSSKESVSVRLVVSRERMTFEGQEVAWGKLPNLLKNVPNRSDTVFELAVASAQMTLRQVNEAKGRAMNLSNQFGFKYLSYIGQHPLGSKGGSSENDNLLDKEVTLMPPYPESYEGARTDKISMQYAVIELLKQVGLKYDWDTSFKNTSPISRKWVTPEISNMTLKQALENILNPVGLTYDIIDSTVRLKRK